MTLAIEVRKAAASEMTVIGNLLQLYLYEFSATENTEVEHDGRYKWDGLEDYWADQDLHPFLFRVDDQLAGFALVQRFSVISKQPIVWDIEDFFVMAKYRRLGVGRYAAKQLFEAFQGKWEIRVINGNERALHFWKATISGQFEKETIPSSIDIDGRFFDLFEFETS